MRNAGLVLGISIALGCGADAGTGACGEVPELVMRLEPGQGRGAYPPSQTGEQVTMVLHDMGVITMLTAERCGDGEPRQLIGPELGLDSAAFLETRAGDLIIGSRKSTGELLRLDPLDVPGQYDVQTIRAFDDASGYIDTALFGGGVLLWQGVRYAVFLPAVVEPDSMPITLQFYPGPDGLAAPPVTLADDLVWFGPSAGGDRLYGLNRAGDLLHIGDVGEVEVLQAGVRALDLAPDSKQLVWQARGDDASEPLYLRTLATGADVSLGIVESGAVASWRWTDTALALLGPEYTLLRAHARLDGALLPPPPTHLEVLGFGPFNPLPDRFILITFDAFEQVGLAWDPAAGTLAEWYRGPGRDLRGEFFPVAEGLRYTLRAPDTAITQLWLSRLDGSPGELLVPHYTGEDSQLRDGRIVMRLEDSFTGDRSLVIIDPVAGTTETLANDVGGWGLSEDQSEILYTRVDGPKAGLWARPL